MAVFEGSRYEDADTTMVLGADGVYRPTLYYTGFDRATPARFKYRMVKQGERFDTIAAEVYRDPEFWWVIANMNPEVAHPADLDAGMIIRVPV